MDDVAPFTNTLRWKPGWSREALQAFGEVAPLRRRFGHFQATLKYDLAWGHLYQPALHNLVFRTSPLQEFIGVSVGKPKNNLYQDRSKHLEVVSNINVKAYPFSLKRNSLHCTYSMKLPEKQGMQMFAYVENVGGFNVPSGWIQQTGKSPNAEPLDGSKHTSSSFDTFAKNWIPYPLSIQDNITSKELEVGLGVNYCKSLRPEPMDVGAEIMMSWNALNFHAKKQTKSPLSVFLDLFRCTVASRYFLDDERHVGFQADTDFEMKLWLLQRLSSNSNVILELNAIPETLHSTNYLAKSSFVMTYEQRYHLENAETKLRVISSDKGDLCIATDISMPDQGAGVSVCGYVNIQTREPNFGIEFWVNDVSELASLFSSSS